jgi:hypothetical protein
MWVISDQMRHWLRVNLIRFFFQAGVYVPLIVRMLIRCQAVSCFKRLRLSRQQIWLQIYVACFLFRQSRLLAWRNFPMSRVVNESNLTLFLNIFWGLQIPPNVINKQCELSHNFLKHCCDWRDSNTDHMFQRRVQCHCTTPPELSNLRFST